MVVVVGYVSTPEGKAALAAAVEEAKTRKARLVVVNSKRARHSRGQTDDDDAASLDSLAADTGLEVEVRHAEHDVEASETLLRVAQEVDADLIVIGLRRRSPVGKLILGSNAQRILLDAACPVLAVKSSGA